MWESEPVFDPIRTNTLFPALLSEHGDTKGEQDLTLHTHDTEQLKHTHTLWDFKCMLLFIVGY